MAYPLQYDTKRVNRPIYSEFDNLSTANRDRGNPHGFPPPTPPGIRVRTTAVRLVKLWVQVHQPVATRRAFSTRVRHDRHGPFIEALGNFIPTLHREGQQQLLLPGTGFLPLAVHEFSDLLAAPFTRLIAGDRSGLRGG